MTPLTFMPAAPPSRPVAPAGGGVADTPSSSSFESALQQAGAADDSQHADAKPVARPAADKPAARSAAPAKRPQDAKGAPRESDESGNEAPAVTPTRTRDAAKRATGSGAHESTDPPNPQSIDTEVPPVVSIQGPVPGPATQPVDLAATSAAITAGTRSALPEAKANAAQPADVVPVVRQIKGKAVEEAKAATGLVDDSVEAIDLAELKSTPPTQPAGQSADVSRAQAPRTVAQAARTLLADALHRAGAPSAQQTQPTNDARPAASSPQDAALTPPTIQESSQTPIAASSEPTLPVKAAAKRPAEASSVQNFTVQASGSSQRESPDAGNGGTSMGSGRREGIPLPQPKADPPVSWPTAFAVRVPEAMTSSLERTGSAPPTLPSSATQSELANVGPQLVRGLQLQAHAGGGDMKMTLTPEHLGEVTLEVQVRHDRVSATLTAETPEVRQWIAAHQDDLKNSLAGIGLSLDELVVKDEGGGGRQDAPGDKPQSQPRRQPAPEHDEPQFEVLA